MPDSPFFLYLETSTLPPALERTPLLSSDVVSLLTTRLSSLAASRIVGLLSHAATLWLGMCFFKCILVGSFLAFRTCPLTSSVISSQHVFQYAFYPTLFSSHSGVLVIVKKNWIFCDYVCYSWNVNIIPNKTVRRGENLKVALFSWIGHGPLPSGALRDRDSLTCRERCRCSCFWLPSVS